MPFETPNLITQETRVPQQVTTDSFVIRPLTITDAEPDYTAVMESRDRISNTFGPDNPWPSSTLTLEQNRIDVAWHQKEHQRRDAFTYTVYDPETETELGCLYIQPTQVIQYDAVVYFWTAETADQRNLTIKIADTIRQWISNDWPFEKITYPGRDIQWADWRQINSNSK